MIDKSLSMFLSYVLPPSSGPKQIKKNPASILHLNHHCSPNLTL